MSLILITEDERSLREGFAMIVVDAGYQTLLASNGIEALAALKSGKVDLILSDGRMSGMNGFQLLRAVRHVAAYVDIPFILASSDTASDVLKEVGPNLIYTFLSKPVHRADLLKTISGLLDDRVSTYAKGSSS